MWEWKLELRTFLELFYHQGTAQVISEDALLDKKMAGCPGPGNGGEWSQILLAAGHKCAPQGSVVGPVLFINDLD